MSFKEKERSKLSELICTWPRAIFKSFKAEPLEFSSELLAFSFLLQLLFWFFMEETSASLFPFSFLFLATLKSFLRCLFDDMFY